MQGEIAFELKAQLRDGGVLAECPISTDIGVRVPDVAWASEEFLRKHGETTPFPEAPEICVEIHPPSNSDHELRRKTRPYLAAGAREVWIVSEEGALQIFDAAGARASSRYAVALALPAREAR